MDRGWDGRGARRALECQRARHVRTECTSEGSATEGLRQRQWKGASSTNASCLAARGSLLSGALEGREGHILHSRERRCGNHRDGKREASFLCLRRSHDLRAVGAVTDAAWRACETRSGLVGRSAAGRMMQAGWLLETSIHRSIAETWCTSLAPAAYESEPFSFYAWPARLRLMRACGLWIGAARAAPEATRQDRHIVSWSAKRYKAAWHLPGTTD